LFPFFLWEHRGSQGGCREQCKANDIGGLFPGFAEKIGASSDIRTGICDDALAGVLLQQFQGNSGVRAGDHFQSRFFSLRATDFSFQVSLFFFHEQDGRHSNIPENDSRPGEVMEGIFCL
jgi:hypothetical protein